MIHTTTSSWLIGHSNLLLIPKDIVISIFETSLAQLIETLTKFLTSDNHNRRFRNNCEIVEESNSSGKNCGRVKFFSLIT